MDYKKIYDQLIEHAQHSPRPQETSEEHHIVPKCIGGSDEKSNKVYLSTHEHIWAHIWLAQIYPDVFGLQLVVSLMVFGDNKNLGRIPTEEQIQESGEARERHRGQTSGEKNPFYGKSHSTETRQKMVENSYMRGKPPWLNPATLRSPKSLDVWFHADDYFKLWKDHQCGCRKLASLFGVSFGMVHQSLVKKFRAGWVPSEDSDWLDFRY